MWYWVGILFVAFFLLFEVFKADQTPPPRFEEVKIASLMTLRNGMIKYIETENPMPGEIKQADFMKYIPLNMIIPGDHKVNIKCVLQSDKTTEVSCDTPETTLYMTTYVPVEIKDTKARKDLLKDIADKTGNNRNIGLWLSNGDIETFSGIKNKVAAPMNLLRPSLPDNVIVIFDRIDSLICETPLVEKLWSKGCKCPENMAWNGSLCIQDYGWGAHERIPNNKAGCELFRSMISSDLTFYTAGEKLVIPDDNGWLYRFSTTVPGLAVNSIRTGDVYGKWLIAVVDDGTGWAGACHAYLWDWEAEGNVGMDVVCKPCGIDTLTGINVVAGIPQTGTAGSGVRFPAAHFQDAKNFMLSITEPPVTP